MESSFNYSNKPINPSINPENTESPTKKIKENKESQVFNQTQKQKENETKQDLSLKIQEIELSDLDPEEQKISSTAVSTLNLPKQKDDLDKLKWKIANIYKKYKEKNPEIFEKSKKSLIDFLFTLYKFDSVTLPKDLNTLSHVKDPITGLKFEKYTETPFILLNILIGKGSQKTIKVAIHPSTLDVMARGSVTGKEIKNVENELKFNSLVKNEPEFLQILGVCNYVGKNGVPKLGMLMEHCAGGDLRDFLIDYTTGTAPAIQDFYWMLSRELLSGLNKLSDCGVLHRDLKPENLILAKDEKGIRHLKISDFGYALMIKDHYEAREFNGGTPSYVPPEYFQEMTKLVMGEKLLAQNKELGEKLIKEGTSNLANTKGDAWAAGLILFELATAGVFSITTLLDEQEDGPKLMRKISALEQHDVDQWFSKKVNKDGTIETIEDLIYHLLQVDPNKRMSTKEAWEAFQTIKQTDTNFCLAEEDLQIWYEKMGFEEEEENEVT